MSDWFGCYKPYPKEAVVPESFTHPAKMGWDLCHRIVDRLEALGLERRSKILDPFAGIFTTGLVGGLRGYEVEGMELEPKFVDLATRNIKKNLNKFSKIPAIFQGDSRKDLIALLDIVGFAAVVGSPAYWESLKSDRNGIDWNKSKPDYPGRKNHPQRQAMHDKKHSELNYGRSPGQISNLPEGDFSAVVSSPPYEAAGWKADENPENPIRRAKERAKHFDRPEIEPGRYGSTANNLGNTAGETYWSACRDIYFNCFLLLKPGGFIALVVKDFVRKKKRVPLCDQTWELLQSVGFEPVERNRAWLVEERQAATFFEANYSVKKERKSFFRRLAEKNGSPKIDWEEVLICKKPL